MKTRKGLEYNFANALFCEDARRDQNHKDILIGVFSGDIFVSAFPAKIPVTVWLNVAVRGRGEDSVEIRIVGPNKKKYVSGQFTLKKNENESEDVISLSTPHAILNVDSPGLLKFQVRLPSGRWKDIIVKDVLERPEASGS